MRAAVLFETGKPLQVLNGVQLPSLMDGQVLVKVHFSGVCHSQLAEVRGHRGEDKYLPHLLGHEAVGTVLEVGGDITKVKPGDKVVLGWIRGEGKDARGAIYQYKDMQLNSGGVTTFSDKTIVSENRLVKLPPGMPDKLAVLLGCALPTGMGIVLNEAQLPEQQLVAVIGLGGIGLSTLMACAAASPKKLIALDVEEHKLNLAKEIGASHCINMKDKNWLEQLHDICPGGVDYSFEAAGLTDTIEYAFQIVRDGGGKCFFASHPAEDKKICLEPHAFHRGKSISGSWGGASAPDRDIPAFVELYNQGKLPHLQKLLSQEYELEEINDALDALEQRVINRALIRCSGDD